jgi:tetratricopeptide (TPR) repeat protein
MKLLLSILLYYYALCCINFSYAQKNSGEETYKSDTARINLLYNHGADFILKHKNEKATDSIITILKTFKSAKGRLLGIARAKTLKGLIFEKSGHADSAIFYYQNSITLYKKLSFNEDIVKLYHRMGFFCFPLQRYDDAEAYFNLATNYIDKKNKESVGINLINKGAIAYARGDFEKCITIYIDALRIAEEMKDDYQISKILNNIGNVYMKQEMYSSALKNYFRSIAIKEKIKDEKSLAKTYNNVGIIYERIDSPYVALEYYEKAIQIYEIQNEQKSLENTYSNIAVVYRKLALINKNKDNYLKKSIEYNEKALVLAQKSKNRYLQSTILSNLGGVYNNLGNYDKALKLIYEGIKLSEEINATENLQFSYQGLANTYTATGNYKKALEYYTKSVAISDSIRKSETSNFISELQTKYETEKKEKEIEMLNNKSRIQNLELEKSIEINRNQQIIIYSLILFFVFILLVVLLLIFFVRKIKKQNQLLNIQNHAINQQKEEIESQRDEIIIQRDKIEQHKQEITDSIYYAKKIQDAMLTPIQVVDQIFANNFILFIPRDIVSGDFYWISKKEHFSFIAVADCTGHGVPGGFMSMLGISFLTEVINRRDVNSAGEALNQLRELVIRALHQTGKSGENKDGMDISLLVIDHKEENLNYYSAQWAGANNPLWIVTNYELQVNSPKSEHITYNSKLIELKGDKMPIGIHFCEHKSFTNHNLEIHKNDFVYLFTDGFADQFGGPDGNTKFKSRKLKQLLLSIQEYSPSDQNKLILNEHLEWKGNTEQVDDILLVGIKF